MLLEMLIVPAGVVAQHIDVPADVVRSVKGALYIRPASTLECTREELVFLQKEHPKLFAKLIQVHKQHAEQDVHAHLRRRLVHEKNEDMRAHIQKHLNEIAVTPLVSPAVTENAPAVEAPVQKKKHDK